jgi:hypothetical protein
MRAFRFRRIRIMPEQQARKMLNGIGILIIPGLLLPKRFADLARRSLSAQAHVVQQSIVQRRQRRSLAAPLMPAFQRIQQAMD